MKVRIDFQLNRQFGIVEQIIFRLVLNGFTDVREIADALPVFSDAVIANGIKTLVNRQIVSIKSEAKRLSLAEPVVAIIEMCLEKSFEIDEPIEVQEVLNESGLLISSSVIGDTGGFKKAILYELLPGIRLDMYMDSLDFVLRKARRGGQDE